jgi:mRNA interferase MazF
MVNRFDIYLVNLDAAPSKDAKNARPCVVISPDEMNHSIRSAIVAPLTAAGASYPTRVIINFLNGERAIVLDQLRTVESSRLIKKIGTLEAADREKALKLLAEMFAD